MEKDLWEYLKSAKKPIVLYGMGNGADRVIDVLKDCGITPAGIFATDGFLRDKVFRGMKLVSYDALKEKFGEMIVLLCFGTSREEAFKSIGKISTEQELYAPDVPVYGGGLFTNRFMSDNRDEFKKVYSALADEKSRQTFECTVNFKLSGKIKYLKECEVSPDEPYDSFLKLTGKEIFADLGAYTGDTVTDFAKRTGIWQEITAVEPDVKTFLKLQKNTGNYNNIRLINACVSEKPGTAFFAKGKGRGSGISEKGKEIRAVSVDEIMSGRKVTFIKADIEGEEVNAVCGMRETLLRDKPKLSFACYHRTEDLISVPAAVGKIRSDYRIYMRHFPYIPAWDTNYYFI